MAKSKKLVSCPVETTLKVVGAKWKVLVIYYLIDEARRFNELHRLLRGIAPRTLTKALREAAFAEDAEQLVGPDRIAQSFTGGHAPWPVLAGERRSRCIELVFSHDSHPEYGAAFSSESMSRVADGPPERK